MIGVLIPTRQRRGLYVATVSNLTTTAGRSDTWRAYGRADDDDRETYAGIASVTFGPRHGYPAIFRYFNELAEQAFADGCRWVLLWNDDMRFTERGWDEALLAIDTDRPRVVDFPGDVSPAVNLGYWQATGRISNQTHCDTWVQFVGDMAGIRSHLWHKVAHIRDEVRDAITYETQAVYDLSSPEFFSSITQSEIADDACKVKEANR